jgi:hypothetical protein
MPHVALQLRHGRTLEKLPPVCIFCEQGVSEFPTIDLHIGDRQMRLGLPLCAQHRGRQLTDLQTQIANTLARARETPHAGGALAASMRLAGELMNDLRNPPMTVPVPNASPAFAMALAAMRKQEAEEFERGLVSAQQPATVPEEAALFSGLNDGAPPIPDGGPPIGRRAKTPSTVPYIVVGVVASFLLVVLAVIAAFVPVR